MDADALVPASAEAMWRDDRAGAGLGMRLDHVAPGLTRLSLTVSEAMANGHGICFGSFIFSLADSAMAVACNSHGLHAPPVSRAGLVGRPRAKPRPNRNPSPTGAI